MDTNMPSEAFLKAQTCLEEIKQKLTDLSLLDLSNIHISHEWSWMPYVKDHLDFLVEQTGGVVDNLREGPPPTIDNDKMLKNEII